MADEEHSNECQFSGIQFAAAGDRLREYPERTAMRGQTTLDFATGMGIFLLSITFVFVFVPGTLQPFTESAQAETAGSDRVADLVVKDLVAEPGKPYVLDGACTAALMSDSPGAGCGFDGSTLSVRLDLPERQFVNVTIREVGGGGTETLCWDRNDERVVRTSSSDCDAGDVELVAGDQPPEYSESVVTARRIVTIDGTRSAVEVRLW